MKPDELIAELIEENYKKQNKTMKALALSRCSVTVQTMNLMQNYLFPACMSWH
tara:strand:- start:151 stop:309 length:159 start_codon:yes stop_codon:yes gene_type:complete